MVHRGLATPSFNNNECQHIKTKLEDEFIVILTAVVSFNRFLRKHAVTRFTDKFIDYVEILKTRFA